MLDYYAILKAPPNASTETIGKCYRAQIKKYHPDVNSAMNAREKTILINQAYEVLADPVKRAQYNREYFCAAESEYVQPMKRRIGFRSFMGGIMMLFFVLGDAVYQSLSKDPVPISQLLFLLFLLYTAIEDRERSITLRVLWGLGGYVFWLVLQGITTFFAWSVGIKAPLAYLLISASQAPAIWFVMRRSLHFAKTIYR